MSTYKTYKVYEQSSNGYWLRGEILIEPYFKPHNEPLLAYKTLTPNECDKLGINPNSHIIFIEVKH